MENLQRMLERRLLGWRSNNYLKAFAYGLGLSFLVFLPFVIVDNGYFLYYGDFNVQQVPFYQMCHDAVRSGNMGWSWTTDLGANFMGSYTFYLLGSPFFWLTIPFPSEAVPYLMAPLLVLKFACVTPTTSPVRKSSRTPTAISWSSAAPMTLHHAGAPALMAARSRARCTG